MHVLPGIVDGARKKLQGGSWIWVGASLANVLEATTSREQCMSAVTSAVVNPPLWYLDTLGVFKGGYMQIFITILASWWSRRGLRGHVQCKTAIDHRHKRPSQKQLAQKTKQVVHGHPKKYCTHACDTHNWVIAVTTSVRFLALFKRNLLRRFAISNLLMSKSHLPPLALSQEFPREICSKVSNFQTVGT